MGRGRLPVTTMIGESVSGGANRGGHRARGLAVFAINNGAVAMTVDTVAEGRRAARSPTAEPADSPSDAPEERWARPTRCAGLNGP